ncbi:MAG TPA: hypothetical protein VLD36_17425 [Burkholderiales bacterium]|nr:hypothetical protein [Burkholderiales bacterium]
MNRFPFRRAVSPHGPIGARRRVRASPVRESRQAYERLLEATDDPVLLEAVRALIDSEVLDRAPRAAR